MNQDLYGIDEPFYFHEPSYNELIIINCCTPFMFKIALYGSLVIYPSNGMCVILGMLWSIYWDYQI